jgi:hypothetical protein
MKFWRASAVELGRAFGFVLQRRCLMRRGVFSLILVLMAVASALAVDALAGEPVLAGLVKARPVVPAAKAVPTLPPQHLYLIRSTLSALHDANRTGNYSVLRDLAAPSFQVTHSAADLAQLFAEARRAPIDLAPAATTEPIMTETARHLSQTLRLAGVIPAPPEHIVFVAQFEAVAGHWRLAALSVGRQPGTHTRAGPP